MILLVFLIGVAAYFALQQIAPRENGQSGQPQNNSNNPTEAILQEANTAKDSAESTFSERDYRAAAKKFGEAAALYKQANAGPKEAEMVVMQQVAEKEADTQERMQNAGSDIEVEFDSSRKEAETP